MLVKFLATVTVTGTATKRALQMFKGSLENLSQIIFLSKRVNLEINSVALINFCPLEFEVVLTYLLVLCFLFASSLLVATGRYQVRLKHGLVSVFSWKFATSF